LEIHLTRFPHGLIVNERLVHTTKRTHEKTNGKRTKKNPVNKMKVERSKGMKDLEQDASRVKGGRGSKGGSRLPRDGGGWTRG